MNNSNDTILNALTEFFRDLLKYWYIVGISLGFMLGGAMFYIKFSAKIIQGGSLGSAEY